ncbi:MAG TPA: response regulator [Caulobacteraceae bacterium]|jgi:CheY-like chemotaxis protein
MAQVLVAEDESFTAMALVDHLEDLGHRVRDAADGAKAIALMASFRPDVLVTDLTMPEVDGYQLIQWLRAQPGPLVPVILITAVPQSRLPRDLPYDGYLGKPVNRDALGQMVARLAAG